MHWEDTQFNMPNHTRAERLTRFYESDFDVFCASAHQVLDSGYDPYGVRSHLGAE